jgi:polynucleotide 5'-kinase involved in rRNA processing
MRRAIPPDPPREVPAEWIALRERLPARGRALVLGPSDAGKSTLCWWLAGQLAAPQGPGVAVVDTDLGQSRIGPPGCVGWQKLDGGPLEFYFVGATTPARRPAAALQATAQACEAAAAAGVAWTVVDTTGYVSGEAGIALKRAKIKRLRPLHVVAIGDHPALDAILAPWEKDEQVALHRLPRPAAARPKTHPARARWRHEGFGEWLTGSNLRWIAAAEREFRHPPAREVFGISPDAADQLKGLLMGFSEASGRCLCVGLLHSVDWAGERVLALCPPEAEAAEVVDFGCVRLEPDGTQVG